MSLPDAITTFSVVMLAVAIGKIYIDKIDVGKYSMKRASIHLLLLGALVWPCLFFAISAFSKANDISLTIIEIGVINFSIFMFSVTLIMPVSEYLSERYL